MILLGWAAALLVAANTAHGDDLARALVQGQLYFTDHPHLHGLLAVGLAVGVLLPWVSSRLLLGRFFPGPLPGQRHPAATPRPRVRRAAGRRPGAGRHHHRRHGRLRARCSSRPWVTFRLAHGWQRTLVWSVVLGLTAYTTSFAAAIVLDQPFGPVLVIALLVTAVLRLVPDR